eukprot:Blabericola_migrator_1__1740@NODE_146_length_12961_cov_103_787110_g127_i0_p1_GENE_NODE_146_length_12961_cov_103_787110_g127_i0NODE_146_length_12961_cov_103_787110_g127_i0_p1_ORF_typecomplete_len1122_score181_01PRT_C/PF08372_10/1_1e03PRT_C/PF08372_10/3e03PRT_C/PF08372_10/0_047_NODE_146_length_12961_cov_103_787110_g127_i0753910904
MFTNSLENVSTKMREGVAKFGEEMMGNVIETLLANQDNAVSQLQELQKWNVVKIVQKLMTTRFFRRERPFVSLDESPLLTEIDKLLCPGDPAERAEASYSLGRLVVDVSAADSIFLVHWRQSKMAFAKNVKWKIRVKFQDKVLDGPVTVLQSPDTLNTATHRWIPPPIRQAEDEGLSNQSFPSMLRWQDCTFDLGHVTDLQSDIQIELLHRKCKDVEKVVYHKDGSASMMGPVPGVNELRSFFGKDPAVGRLSPRTTATQTATADEDDKDDVSEDANTRRKTLTTSWTVYGRVVIPLSVWLTSASLTEDSSTIAPVASAPPLAPSTPTQSPSNAASSKRNKSKALLLRPHLMSIRSKCCTSGWYHLYPPNQQEGEYKFLKPCSGYPGLGMLNPLISLGFLKVKVTFQPRYNPYVMALLSNSNPLQRTWIMPTKFDLQVFESSGIRTHHIAMFTPRWLRRFGHFGSLYIKGWDTLSFMDYFSLSLFWGVILYTVVFAPPFFLPLSVALLVYIVSLSYRRTPSDTSGTCYYVTPPAAKLNILPSGALDNVFADDQQEAIHQAFGSRKPRGRGVLQEWMDSAYLDLQAPRIGFFDSDERSGRATGSSTPVLELSADGLTPNPHLLSPLSNFFRSSPSEENLLLTQSPMASGIVASLLIPPPARPSAIATVFGLASLSVRDCTSYAPVYPLFADDCPDVDLLLLKHLGLLVLEGVQLMCCTTCTILEKFKIAFDWTDPYITVISLSIVLLLAIQVSFLLWLAFKLPIWVLRFVFLLAPAIAMVLLTDPVILALTGAAAQIDKAAIALFKWQPESAVVYRVCVNIWDVFLVQGLLTDTDREERYRMMSQTFEALNRGSSTKTTITPPETAASSNPATAAPPAPGNDTQKKEWFALFKRKASGPMITEFQPQIRKKLQYAGSNFMAGLRARKSRPLTVVQSEAASGNKLRQHKYEADDERKNGAIGVRSTMTIVQEQPTSGVQHTLVAQGKPILGRFLMVVWMISELVVSWLMADVILFLIKAEARFIFNWFMKLPDRREIEHRQIAATQYMGPDLSSFIVSRGCDSLSVPSDSGSRTPGGVTSPNKTDLNEFYCQASGVLYKARKQAGWTAALSKPGPGNPVTPAR